MRREQSPKRRPSRRAVATRRPGRQPRLRTISEERWAFIAELDEGPEPVLRDLIARVARGDLIHGHAL